MLIVDAGQSGCWKIRLFLVQSFTLSKINICYPLCYKTNRIHKGVEAETRKSQARFKINQVSSEALPRMRLE